MAARNKNKNNRNDTEWFGYQGYFSCPWYLYRNRNFRNKKKESSLQSVNEKILAQYKQTPLDVNVVKVDEAEADEMWSFVGKKKNQRWLWHAIDHNTGHVLAYVMGKHQDEVLLELKTLLEPFGVAHFYTDGWGGYERHIPPEKLSVGKANTQKIERKTICFSKSEKMHDIIIGMFINRYEFAVLL